MALLNRNLYHRIEWNLTLKTQTPLFIGGKKSKKDADSSLNKSLSTNDNKHFIIPGSSLRGVFRAFTYQVLETICYDKETVKEIVNNLFGFVSDKEKKKAKKGHIWIADSYIPKDQETIMIKNITPIDRIKQIPLAPLRFECIAPNQTFHMRMIIENATLEQLGIIALFLREIKYEQITFGGSTARGFGNVKLEQIQVTVTLYNKDKNNLKTLDNTQIPLNGVHWTTQNEILFSVWTNNDWNESIEWLKPGIMALKRLSEKVMK
jgi:CRISPR/Cas system CSM-associated protein Csm3 (group 7 of RAMP superfamily)